MQNPKSSGSIKSTSRSEGARKISPRSVSSDRSSGRVVRQLKTTGFDANSSTSIILTPRTTSPKIVDRVSPRVPAPEKKRVGRIFELEAQVTQLEDALSTVKDQLIVSESWKKQAKIDAEESRKELLALTLKLEEFQKLLPRLSSNEAHDEHDDDELKVKLDTTSESETKQGELVYEEIHILKENMAEKLSLIEEMKNQLEDSKSLESQAHALASETLLQLETAKKTMESLKLNSNEYNAIVLELEQSRARVSSLEGIIGKINTTDLKSEFEDIIAMKSGQTLDITAELKKSKLDIKELKANLMDKETELQCIREENEDLNTKLANFIVGKQEYKMEHELKQEINGLKSMLTSLETELCEKKDENEKLNLEIKKLNGFMESSKQDFDILKSKLYEKSDENEKLKLEIKKINNVMDTSKQDFYGLKSKLKEKSDENENLKLEIKKTDGMNEEIKKSMNEQLEAVKTSNCEMEEELKRMKTQMSQWRKAAEAATSMLCDENSDTNGRMVVDRTWSMGHYSPIKRVNIGSPCNLDIDDDNGDDDEFSKRKNGNVLKKIGVLWKKPQNK